ncbi:MAG: acyclic terpene utilization AtuA family protein, partial [Gemmataceae bacterium]
AEIRPDGTFNLSKPAGSGGSVTIETVSEQLLYEVGAPAAYLTPDVTADFTSLALDSAGTDTVRVSGARGRPCPSTLKVSIAYRDGWTAAGTLVISGPKAADKARRAGEMVLARLARCDALPEKHLVECLGAGDSLPGVLPPSDPPEVVLRIAVRDKRKGVVERFSRELAPLVTSGPPGTTGYTTGRPTVREVFAYWPSLIHRDVVQPQVNIL